MKIKEKSRGVALVLIGAMLVSALAMPLFSGFGGIGAEPVQEGTRAVEWYNANWLYRMPLYVSNSGAVALVNATVRVDLNATNGFDFSHAQADLDDVRFVADDHFTVYSHWLEFVNATLEDSVFWVLFPSLEVGNNVFWVYYGNAAATDVSNGSAVFSHFDDFDEHTTNRDVYISNVCGSNMIYEKAAAPEFIPDSTLWTENQKKFMGISTGTNGTTNLWHELCYGTYVNASYAVICGADSPDGSAWTRYATQPIINHSATGESCDFYKATEPDFLHNISLAGDEYKNYQKEIEPAGYSGCYNIFYSALNVTNWSISMAYSDTFDQAWTKIGFAVHNGSTTDGFWNSHGIRKPVVFDLDDYYYMFYAGNNDVNTTWKIGIARSTNLITWTDLHAFSVLNESAWGWDEASVIPLDIFFDGTHTTLMYAGMNDSLDWRIGYAKFADDTFTDPTKWGGVIPLGDTFDALDANYGTGCVIDEDETTEYYKLYHTGKNATYTSMGSAICRNSTWDHNGTYRSCYAIQNFADNTMKLRVDTNETYVTKNLYGLAGADWDNNSASVDWWPGTSLNDNNASVCMRSSGGAWAARDHYAAHLDVTNDYVVCSENANGVDTVHDYDAVILTSPYDDQHLLNVRCYGDEIHAYAENHPEDVYANSSVTDATLKSGIFALQTYEPSPMDFDFFRVSGSTNATIGTSTGTEDQYDGVPDQGGDNGDNGDANGNGDTTPPTTIIDQDVLEITLPWLLLLIGAALIIVGFLWKSAKDPYRMVLRIILIAVGLILLIWALSTAL